jgi:hypothetical protein
MPQEAASERATNANGEVMPDGIDVLEVTDSMFDELMVWRIC